ncbi:uncharacterized protein LOC126968135 [Leptidea sinapis]|uniref:uncharacterized protein LOC126968135 n=1 Tax=Leptidea sinapis TaxID=189913 RepID=UPI0021C3A581|nr:uncharacterized protein LOC126968135 [Leptidea sinapis]
MCSSGHMMKIRSSISDHKVTMTYVCLDDGKPGVDEDDHCCKTSDKFEDKLEEDRPIRVERSKALHELVESHRHDDAIYGESTHKAVKYNITPSITTIRLPDVEEESNDPRNQANILKLTKMKWLTEGQEESPESSSPSLSPTNSTVSTCSRESYDAHSKIYPCISSGDKCLSTILRLDKEHNMFGLSNIAIVGKKTSRRSRKDDERPAFPQTAIVQVCCGGSCCRHKSNTDLPASLKCGGCRACCKDPYCSFCVGSCGTPCEEPPCPSVCSTCPSQKCKVPCVSSRCLMDSSNSFGLKISLKRKAKFEPPVVELTPRSSCVLQKMAGRQP